MTTIAWRQMLLGAGYTPREVRRLLRDRHLHVVRRGAYVLDAPPSEPEARHLLAVRAALADVAADAVVSHVSAALVHGLPVWGVELARVHVIRDRRNGGRLGPGVHVHSAALDPGDVVHVAGIPVTTPSRTVADLARSQPLQQTVVVADAALHVELVTPTGLVEALDRSPRRPGSTAARRAIAFADGLAESVGESRSRVLMAAHGLPVPVLQHPVQSHRGRDLGRVDFWWPGWGTVGEFDGRIKYSRLLRPGQEPGDAVWEEKLREDAIRDTGKAVVRWTWSDLDQFGEVVQRVRHCAARRYSSQPAGAL